ncbi:MAG TPA: nitroreductase [Steroidobacteraceae bacterium]|jgi:nitroreductase|nr:nitroreductase [Steroidobacteraceae bacterium]
MKVSEALDSRMSCRAFLPDPVPEATLRQILGAASRAPSGGNLQPWFVDVLTGVPLAALVERIRAQVPQYPLGYPSEYPVYPSPLGEPYRTRRYQNGEDLYATIGVPRSDRAARLRQFAHNFEGFGAPVMLFICIDRSMGAAQWADLGMFMQSIMLLAREHGLHSCPQESWSGWYREVAEAVALPASRMLFSGIAVGYRDDSAPINRLRTARAPLEEFATFRGFE